MFIPSSEEEGKGVVVKDGLGGSAFRLTVRLKHPVTLKGDLQNDRQKRLKEFTTEAQRARRKGLLDVYLLFRGRGERGCC
jgi:hypothetical protein